MTWAAVTSRVQCRETFPPRRHLVHGHCVPSPWTRCHGWLGALAPSTQLGHTPRPGPAPPATPCPTGAGPSPPATSGCTVPPPRRRGYRRPMSEHYDVAVL